MTDSITIILPCAGGGKRLGLTTPKELFEIFNGTHLIDYSLGHIRAAHAKQLDITVAVVARPWKRGVAAYVAENLPDIPVTMVMFNDDYSEWPGSVLSAERFFSEKNLVLLPDSYLALKNTETDQQGNTLVELMCRELQDNRAVFGTVACDDPDLLSQLGAVAVENGKIVRFQDKPEQDQDQFNGFWGSYGFRKEFGESLYKYLIQSVRHQPLPLEEQPFHPAGAVPIDYYRDLGTWERVRAFRREFQSK